ncbi:MAG: CRISPR-associated helicase/endonuclease Cas3 [Herpetosiphonaceae bacterium]|nr:MAG: CRISPR-associated helicase/endonuclease Cas3 [Herpetosiphonaceae bacterium]
MELRPFQQKVYRHVLEGKSVLLQAPTGSGKTRAALAPFIMNLDRFLKGRGGERLPLTCRYAVPLRTLVEQFFTVYAQLTTKLGGQDRLYRGVAAQTGTQPGDPFFEHTVTFCTIDQLLASALGVPYSMSLRLANLNVAAIAGSYLVFDEFHLYPLERGARGALTTTLALLELLRVGQTRLTPFVMMTATFSSKLLERLQGLLDAEIVRVDDADELAQINAGRQRRWVLQERPLTAEAVLQEHHDCSLVVCNRVRRAQQLYSELCRRLQDQGRHDVKVVLLHSQLLETDRDQRQKEVMAALGADSWRKGSYTGPNIIVVATQVVEAGLDISVRTLHSEVAPANSLIQRAGRCARFEQQHGTVMIYPIAAETPGDYLPYDQVTVSTTLSELRGFDGRIVGFNEEQELIDAVHSDADLKLLDTYAIEESAIKTQIARGWSNQELSIRADLIRDVQQVQVLIHDDPNAAITVAPWQWQAFGLRPERLKRLLDRSGQVDDPFDLPSVVAWRANPLPNDEPEAPARHQQRYEWIRLNSSADAVTALFVALSPEIITYDCELGLVLRDDKLLDPWPAEPFRSARIKQNSSAYNWAFYRQESYAEHIDGLLHAYYNTGIRAQQAYLRQRLEQVARLDPGAIDHAIRLAIACHDLGKLGTGWQQWVTRWQRLLCETYPERAQSYTQRPIPLVHTDYDEREHRELQRKLGRRPPHACEGAYLAQALVEDSLGYGLDMDASAPQGQLARATLAAICRHHAPGSSEYQQVTLVSEARQALQEALELALGGSGRGADVSQMELEIATASHFSKSEITIPSRDELVETLLYFVIVRALRLADMRALQTK